MDFNRRSLRGASWLALIFLLSLGLSIRSPAAQPTETERLRAAWNGELAALATGSERRAFLAANLENLSAGYFYSFAAVEALVEDGSPAARLILQHRLAMSGKRSMDSRVVGKLQMAIVQLEILDSLARVQTPSDGVSVLESALFDNAIIARISFGFRRDFFNWILDKVAKIDVAQSVLLLSKVMRGESFDVNVRYTAQELMVSHGWLLPNERELLVSHRYQRRSN
jgi:hypothetical protein